jgi:hypothetical protein
MRLVAAYAIVFYGLIAVAEVPGAVRAGRMAAAAGLVQALAGITMVLAAFGVLLGLRWALVPAVATIAGLSLLSAYHAYLLRPRSALWGQGARSLLALALVAMLVFGG